jgi:hypothetical protein
MARVKIILTDTSVFIIFIIISGRCSQILEGQIKYVAHKDGHLMPHALPVSANCVFVNKSNFATDFKSSRHGMYSELKAQPH